MNLFIEDKLSETKQNKEPKMVQIALWKLMIRIWKTLCFIIYLSMCVCVCNYVQSLIILKCSFFFKVLDWSELFSSCVLTLLLMIKLKEYNNSIERDFIICQLKQTENPFVHVYDTIRIHCRLQSLFWHKTRIVVNSVRVKLTKWSARWAFKPYYIWGHIRNQIYWVAFSNVCQYRYL